MTGGSFDARIHESNPPDVAKIELILAEMVIAVQELHRLNIYHGDLNTRNFLIDSDGHLLLTDFGSSKILSNSEANATNDWSSLRNVFFTVFCNTFCDETRMSLVELLKTMTDERLPGG